MAAGNSLQKREWDVEFTVWSLQHFCRSEPKNIVSLIKENAIQLQFFRFIGKLFNRYDAWSQKDRGLKFKLGD